MFEQLWQQPKNQKIAILLAVVGVITPIAGLQKFYLRQPRWGILYLLLFATPIPHIASVIDVFWYFFLDQEKFQRRFNPELAEADPPPTPTTNPENIDLVAQGLRQLEQLRQEGLLTEYEFEQKRRQLLNQI
ncbi:NINE protein [Spirulina sp. CS-785/01]|uniref:NINE protein n=1 Tax=Spirulina sp. CS-785/01 TaxID=3021716 RepID=UPI002330F2CE|nr:NINE protein [Spirulina sp. CS-785/01]MDB9312435.1 NINE protein [Spirulina sp. CS-785/01]